uniref:N-acetyltransferase domain-containing protein n=1 Tax=Musa acuminata subsp. malaccensis TaxID=214687 RepID=A0A804JPF6_MUSAM|nr:PREDICTED: N-alpha-acetyltransferase 50-like isoform X3 [Musa acuminata subsp. malaccensis]
MGAGEGGGEMAAAAVSLDGVRDKNVMQLKKLNTALFPVRYNDKYYADALASGDFTRLGRSRLLPALDLKEGGAICVYIMTLGVLAPYRGLGVGTKLLNHVLDLSHKQNIWEIYLHVQTNNDDAIAFYKRFGFEITDTIRNYYMNISPPDCYVLSKVIPQPHSKK